MADRAAQLEVMLGYYYGRSASNRPVVQRKITHEQLAMIAGANRQWVTMTLGRLQKRGIISVTRQCIVIAQYDLLQAYASKP